MNYRNSILRGATVLALLGAVSLATPALAKHAKHAAATSASDAQEEQTTAQLNQQQLNGGAQANGSGTAQSTMGNGSPAPSTAPTNSGSNSEQPATPPH